jgi:hypothetical protein
MNSLGPAAKIGWIAILAIALLTTSLQAKLGLYHPEQSQEHLVSKAFKLSECRVERADPESPATAVAVITATMAADDRRSEPDFLEYSAPEIRPIFHSSSYWSRPPPVRS